MRKIIGIIFLIVCLTPTFGCKKADAYSDSISELKQDIYTGNSEEYPLTADYGFKESPYTLDGVVSTPIYGYTFKLHIIPDEAERILEFYDDEKKYSAAFGLDELTGEYKAFIEIQKHFEKQFSVNLICGAEIKSVLLTSNLPDGTISYKKALALLTENQRRFFDAYTVDGKFNAEIYMRIFVKDLKPYWYVAVSSGENKLKAMLIDGLNGELLAIKDVF